MGAAHYPPSGMDGCPLGVDQRLRVITQEMKRDRKDPVRYRNGDRVTGLFGNHLGAATERKGALVVLKTMA